jgi:hypothetical protein
MNKLTEQPAKPPEIHLHNVDESGFSGEARRKFTRAGFAGAGVILTLASRSALATGTGTGGKTPSGFCSVNVTSSGHGQPVLCDGRNADYWKGCKNQWPSSCNTKKRFSQEFNCNGRSSTYYQSCNLVHLIDYDDNDRDSDNRDYLIWKYGRFYSSFMNYYNTHTTGTYKFGGKNGKDYDESEIGKCVVAALLNCRSGRNKFLKEETIKAIFNEYQSKGYFTPTAGWKWYAADIVKYLKSTQS